MLRACGKDQPPVYAALSHQPKAPPPEKAPLQKAGRFQHWLGPQNHLATVDPSRTHAWEWEGLLCSGCGLRLHHPRMRKHLEARQAVPCGVGQKVRGSPHACASRTNGLSVSAEVKPLFWIMRKSLSPSRLPASFPEGPSLKPGPRPVREVASFSTKKSFNCLRVEVYPQPPALLPGGISSLH